MSLNQNIELLRLTTAGSVDDGKSTLIGRLLHDCQSIFEDQLLAVENTCSKVGKEVDLALLLDGLKAEREQGITIDVAYRYFATAKRRFIIADVPGHEQYTRNMVTGASNAQLALILVDARKGLLPQSKRHLFITAMLGIPHVAIIVNKMDLVEYDQKVFEEIKADFDAFSRKLNVSDLQYIPVSALKGDMVVERGESMNWYTGRTMLDYLETVHVASDLNLIDFRFPVQHVLRPHQDFRGYAGRIQGGMVRPGEKVIVLPSRKTSTVKALYHHGNPKEEAYNSQSVVVTLEDEIDISRGDMLVRENNLPEVSDRVEATISWMSDDALEENKHYLIKLGTKTTPCYIEKLRYKIDIDTLHREESSALYMNDIGRVVIKSNEPLLFDSYKQNKPTGSFILIDELSNNTVAGGIIIHKGRKLDHVAQGKVTLHKGAVLWFTGLSGAGKSTIADRLHEVLEQMQVKSERLDGDIVREGLTKDLGFSKEDRDTNIERVTFVAKLLSKHGVMVLATFISPYQAHRNYVKEHVNNVIEIFVDASLDTCIKRDVKGLYKKALNNEINNFTGVSDPFEAPVSPDIHVKTDEKTLDECVEEIIEYLKQNKYLS